MHYKKRYRGTDIQRDQQTHKQRARMKRESADLRVGELDGVLEVIIFAKGELVVPELGKPAWLDAAAKPCIGKCFRVRV